MRRGLRDDRDGVGISSAGDEKRAQDNKSDKNSEWLHAGERSGTHIEVSTLLATAALAGAQGISDMFSQAKLIC
jgi:hypothetical protein